MENFIKEAKGGFYFDKTDSPRFLNTALGIVHQCGTFVH
jgi:hypothetical protein